MARQKDPQRRDMILETALARFAERGFHAVSVKELADAAGISLGSLYTYFDTKEQLVNELFRKWKMAFGEAASIGLDGLRGREAHRRLWHNIGAFISANPRVFSFLEAQLHKTYLDRESLQLEMALTQSAVQFYIDRLELGFNAEQAQLAISAAFGVYVQVLKTSTAGLLRFDAATREALERMAWQMTASF
jgi:AcrR family transcriptional regulator